MYHRILLVSRQNGERTYGRNYSYNRQYESPVSDEEAVKRGEIMINSIKSRRK
jgi:hypothetical protein